MGSWYGIPTRRLMLSIRARKAQKVLSNLVPLGSAQAHSRVLNHIISASIILTMRYVLAVLGLVGAVVSGLALQVHYTIATTPCSINEKWDCGVVNHSSYSMISGIPVAAIGIAGYLVLVWLALSRQRAVLTAAAVVGLAFSLYLAHIERDILGAWCLYCVISLADIAIMMVMGFIWLIVDAVQRQRRRRW